MIFNSKKRKQSVMDFFEYVESKILPQEKETEIIDGIKNQLKAGRELIEYNEWGIAFENLSSALVEHTIIIDREGSKIVERVLKLCKIDKKWKFDLKRIISSGYITGSWKLSNAKELAKENKYTFYKPSTEITKKLKIGNLVKVTFEFRSSNKEHPSAERMWLQISEVSEKCFVGKLDNHPFYIHDLYVGDKINFQHKHIIDHDLELTEPNLVDKYINRCIINNQILYDNAPINQLYREEPLEKDDSEFDDTGWRIFVGNETSQYMENPTNFGYVSLGAVLSRDDSIIDLLDFPVGSDFIRGKDGKFKKRE